MKEVIFSILSLIVCTVVAFATLIYGLNLWGWWYLLPVIGTILITVYNINLPGILYFIFSVGVAATASAHAGLFVGLFTFAVLWIFIMPDGAPDDESILFIEFQTRAYACFITLMFFGFASGISPRPKYMCTEDIEKENIAVVMEQKKTEKTTTDITFPKEDTVVVKHSTGNIE